VGHLLRWPGKRRRIALFCKCCILYTPNGLLRNFTWAFIVQFVFLTAGTRLLIRHLSQRNDPRAVSTSSSTIGLSDHCGSVLSA
jgi:hypothetical protein